MAILLMLVAFYLAQMSGSNFVSLPNPMTAKEAYTACKNQNTTLGLPGLDDNKTLNGLLNNTEDLGVWTGKYIEFAPWVVAGVCYTIDNPLRHNVSYNSNSGSACLQSCGKDTDSVFVRNAECICSEGYLYGTFSEYQLCNQHCSDGGACGGTGKLYTNYQRCHRNKTCNDDSPIQHNCMTIDLSCNMTTAACHEKHFPVCKTDNTTDVIKFFVSKTDDLQKKSWKDANNFCREHGGVLADFLDRAGSLKSQWDSAGFNLTAPKFWIALNRANRSGKALTGTSSFKNSSRCLFIRKGSRAIETKSCSLQAYASCQKIINDPDIPVTQTLNNTPPSVTDNTPFPSSDNTPSPSDDSTPSPSGDSTPSPSGDSTPSTTTANTPSTATKPITIYIVVPSVAAVIAVIGIGIFFLMKKRRKSPTTLRQETRPNYDYTEIGDEQTPGTSGLKMQVLETNTAIASGRKLNLGTVHEKGTTDEGNYDQMDNKSSLKHKSDVCESNAYERAFPMQEGVYNEIQTGADNSEADARDSFYATAQSCSTMEGNYDAFKKQNISTGAESDYDHVAHKTD